LFIGLILGVILISGCIGSQKPTCNKPYILVGNECCLDENDDGICDKDKPITTTSTKLTVIGSECFEKRSYNEMYFCLIREAMKIGDCGKIFPRETVSRMFDIPLKNLTKEMVSNTITSCNFIFGMKLVDPNLYCTAIDKLGDATEKNKQMCRLMIVYKNKNTTGCYGISDNQERITCLALTKEDSGLCSNDDDCKQTYAIFKKDPVICAQITDGSERSECYFTLDLLSDEDICDIVDSKTGVSVCETPPEPDFRYKNFKFPKFPAL